MAQELSSRLEELVSKGRLPGVGAVAIDKSGKQLYNSAFGTINAVEAGSKPFTNDTQAIFWSCTKFLTCIAVLQQLEQGNIGSLDDAVSKYLPDQANIQVITAIDAQNKVQSRPQKKEMKIIHLLTHTSGYTYDFWDQLMYDYRASTGQPQGTYTTTGADWQFEDVFLEFDAGTRYNYGMSIDILGFIVEKLSNMTLPQYVGKYVTGPMGMNRTSAYLEDNDWLQCHVKSPEGQLTPVEAIVPAKEPYKFGGGHYIVSTINDYSQVLLTILNGGTHPRTGKTILKPETIREYVFKDFIPHVGCSPDEIGKISPSLVPGLSVEGEFLPGVKKGWSCGLMLNLDAVPGGRSANSGSWAGLGNIYYWIDPTAGKAGIFATNVLPFFDKDCRDASDMFEKMVYSS